MCEISRSCVKGNRHYNKFPPMLTFWMTTTDDDDDARGMPLAFHALSGGELKTTSYFINTKNIWYLRNNVSYLRNIISFFK